MVEKNNCNYGKEGEDIALDHLKTLGYRIIKQNYRVGKLGEIDIVAQDREYICFIEVKTRSTLIYGMPSEAVTLRKQRSIIRMAQIYLKQHRLFDHCVRFDVVEVFTGSQGKLVNNSHIHVIKDAFYER